MIVKFGFKQERNKYNIISELISSCLCLLIYLMKTAIQKTTRKYKEERTYTNVLLSHVNILWSYALRLHRRSKFIYIYICIHSNVYIHVYIYIYRDWIILAHDMLFMRRDCGSLFFEPGCRFVEQKKKARVWHFAIVEPWWRPQIRRS